jgi:hypothetical protein
METTSKISESLPPLRMFHMDNYFTRVPSTSTSTLLKKTKLNPYSPQPAVHQIFSSLSFVQLPAGRSRPAVNAASQKKHVALVPQSVPLSSMSRNPERHETLVQSPLLSRMCSPTTSDAAPKTSLSSLSPLREKL